MTVRTNLALRKPNILRGKKLVEAVKAQPTDSKGPKGILEKEIIFRKLLLALDEPTRFSVVHELSDVDNDLSRQLLMGVLAVDSSALVRHEAAFALGCIGNEHSLPVLRQALMTDKSPMVRHESAMAMSEIGTESDIGVLTTALNDASREQHARHPRQIINGCAIDTDVDDRAFMQDATGTARELHEGRDQAADRPRSVQQRQLIEFGRERCRQRICGRFVHREDDLEERVGCCLAE